jgi:spermidine/putrescine transport system substrate-binding protein
MALLKNGITDTNTSSQSDIDQAKADLITLVNDQSAAVTINGAYAKLPDDVYWLHQAWSGDMIGAKWYLPKGTSQDVLGYWYPEDGKGVVGNDCIAIPGSAQNPRLAHEFLNFMLDKKYAMQNFAQWNGYQPPLTSIDPSTLIPQGIVPKSEPMSVVTPQDFDEGYWLLELSPSTDQVWLDAWDQIKAGA